ncbi:MAG: class I SAM-dependent DNA methyltransferase, partial [Chloroflexota bacterium]
MGVKEQLETFVDWWRQYCTGDEKGEAQIFLDRLFLAFGYKGALEAGGRYEKRVRTHRSGRAAVAFADYVLPGRVLIEMKKRGEHLGNHYDQLEEYWKSLETKPRYSLLCNFDEFWIYEFPTQFYDPVDCVRIEDLPERIAALEFLVPGSTKPPVFQNNLVDVTKNAAHSLSQVFKSLIRRGVERHVAQRFILQCMLALFAEDIGLLPDSTFTRIIEESLEGDENTYDLITLLFFMMNTPGVKPVGRFAGVDYFDGGLFGRIDPVHLWPEELRLLREAARENWSDIRPAIFGTIFEDSMEKEERHQIGAHFTSEQDIKRIVDPVIVEPWNARIEAAGSVEELRALHAELCAYQVLDPACGSGNFLYIAYREMKKLERRILDRLEELEGEPPAPTQFVSARQFWGFDIKDFAVELARVTMTIAKKLA